MATLKLHKTQDTRPKGEEEEEEEDGGQTKGTGDGATLRLKVTIYRE